ncbi:MAG: NAD-dependent DNA ligase [Ruminiclostridium sp.]
MSNSPTQTVGYTVVSSLEKTQHRIPLLSLDKTKLLTELIKFIGNKPILLMLKLDGLTVKLTYEDGKLKEAATRGDGEVGEIITHNVAAFQNVPLCIPYTGRLVVSGEAFIFKNDFEEMRDTLLDSSGNPYRNPRNLAAGSVRLLDAAVCRQRRVSFLPFNVLEGLESNVMVADYKAGKLLELQKLGFDRCDFIYLDSVVSEEELQKSIDKLHNRAEQKSIPIDEIVATYDSISYSRSCGRTEHHYKDGLAYKFEDELFETVLQSIEWTPTRFGEISSVAIFDPTRTRRLQASHLQD